MQSKMHQAIADGQVTYEQYTRYAKALPGKLLKHHWYDRTLLDKEFFKDSHFYQVLKKQGAKI